MRRDFNKSGDSNVAVSRSQAPSRVTDLLRLWKFRLTAVVVLSAFLAYMILQTRFSLAVAGLLIVGGFLVTAAANALNQVLEKEYDAVMQRTKDRPLAAGRMRRSEAVLWAGFMSLLGITMLSAIHPLCGFLGMISLLSYAFLYTPLKRMGGIAVPVGAIPGALPVVIGAIAAQGGLSIEAFVLFAIQFLWQFPHFWSIAWLAHEDYQRAGFRLLPWGMESPTGETGWYSMLYSLLIIPFIAWGLYAGFFTGWAAILMILITLAYAWPGWTLHKTNNETSARRLLYASLVYLPVILMIWYIG